MPPLSRLLALLPLALWPTLAGAALPPVNFGREVLPILSDKCFYCHGPDEKKRKAGRRLDTLEGATAEQDGVIAVVPGKVAESEMITRILSTDREEVMPPPKANKTLTPAQIETLRRWVAEGAKWGKHWAFEKPERPEVPKVEGAANPIDAFIRARLDREELKPSP
jgi:mono/diheme cytochrome c family protein